MRGRVLAGLELGALLGRGSSGAVYEASRDGRALAVKVALETGNPGEAYRRLRREASIHGSVRHPVVPAVFEVGVDNGVAYLISERSPGQSLEARLARGPLTPAQVVGLGLALAGALREIHRRGVTHRDLKPSNVLWSEEGEVHLIDFGLAVTTAGSPDGEAGESPGRREGLVGALRYASPEQLGVLRRPVDQRSDLYSLGIVLHEALTGQPLFVAADPSSLLHAQASSVPPRLAALGIDASAELDQLLSELLAKDPDDRPADAWEVLERLRALPEHTDEDSGTRTPSSGLVGREALLRRLQHWMEDGQPGIAAVIGAPGSGKSTLAEALLDKVRRGRGLALRGCGLLDEAQVLSAFRGILGGLRQGLRALGPRRSARLLARVRAAAQELGPLLTAIEPELHELLDAPASRGPLVDGRDVQVQALATFLHRLGTPEAPLLLVLDDAQWLDDDSVLCLLTLARRGLSPGLRVLLLGRDEPATGVLLARLAAEDQDEGALRIELGPLGPEAARDLIAANLGRLPDPALVDRVISLCEGSPLAIVQHLHALKDSGVLLPHWGGWRVDEEQWRSMNLPGEVFTILQARLSTLSPDGQQLLFTAATLGEGVDLDLLLAVLPDWTLERAQERVAECLAAQLLEVRGPAGRLAFVHDRIREAALRLSAGEVEELHLRAAQHLGRSTEGETEGEADRPLRCARHRLAAGARSPRAETVAACRQAMILSARRHAHAQVVELLEAVLALPGVQEEPAALRQELHALGARSGFELQRIELAVAHARRALELARAPQERASLRGLLARSEMIHFASRAALEELDAAFAELGESLPGREIADPAALQGHLLQLLGSLLPQVLQGHGRGAAEGEARARAEVLGELGDMAFLVGYYERRPLLALQGGLVSLRAAHELGQGASACRGLSTAAMLLGLLGKADLACRFADMALETARQGGEVQVLAVTQAHAAIALHFAGSPERALALQTEVSERYADFLGPLSFQNMCIDLAWNHMVRGRARRALQVSEGALERIGTEAGVFLSAYACRAAAAAAAAATQLGQRARAQAHLQKVAALRGVVPADRTIPWVSVEGFLVGVHGAFGDDDEQADAARDRYERWGQSPERAALHSKHVYLFDAWARLHRLQAHPEDPARRAAAEASLEALERAVSGPTLRAHERVIRAELARLRGEPEAALELVEQARALGFEHYNPWVLAQCARTRAEVEELRGRTEQAAHLRLEAWSLAHREQWDTTGWDPRGTRDALDPGTFPTALAGSSSGTGDSASGRTYGGTRLDGHDLIVRQQLDGILALARSTASVIDPVEHSRIALDEILRQLGAERAFILTPEREGDLRLFCARDRNGRDLTNPDEYSRVAIDQAMRTGLPVLVSSKADAISLGSASMIEYGLRSVLVAPMQVGERLVGLLYVENRLAHGVFTADHLELLRALGNQIAAAMQTVRAARLELDLQAEIERRRLAEAIQGMMARVSSTLDVTEGLSRMLIAIGSLLQVDRGLVAAVEGEDLVVGSPMGLGREEAAEIVRHVQGLLRTRTNAGQPERLRVSVAPEAAPLRLAVTTISLRDTRIAHLVLVEDPTHPLSNDQLALLGVLVNQASVAIENARLFRKVQEQAATDGLTGLLNRRELLHHAEAAVLQAEVEQVPLSALILDIDRFKPVNDTYGHLVGDAVIQAVARVCQAHLRQLDLIGRYGGEEFVAILPHTDASLARSVAERLRKAVEEVQLATPHVTVTISLGVAERRPGQDLKSLLNEADLALYTSKTRGRNQTTVYSS